MFKVRAPGQPRFPARRIFLDTPRARAKSSASAPGIHPVKQRPVPRRPDVGSRVCKNCAQWLCAANHIIKPATYGPDEWFRTHDEWAKARHDIISWSFCDNSGHPGLEAPTGLKWDLRARNRRTTRAAVCCSSNPGVLSMSSAWGKTCGHSTTYGAGVKRTKKWLIDRQQAEAARAVRRPAATGPRETAPPPSNEAGG